MTIDEMLKAAGPASCYVPVATNQLLTGLANAVRELQTTNAAQLAVIEAVRAVAAHSDGIAGWHQNGNIATWSEVLPELEDCATAGPQTDPLEERRRRNREANARARAKETPEQRASRQEKNRERMRKSRGGEGQS
ncbi:hypothetical protein B2M27_23205 [Kluyvera intermedia]|uniref:Uncharacterized protein n=1 Tax=Kluyvera intermedia TaxID=61648 RepID=A0ABX3U8Y9_KLUIN|nr:hypothetical protein [Kluyvera intermedia]ORJ47993.1 hypothetical protein B2M27_23205 [Kluyvera intermedia]